MESLMSKTVTINGINTAELHKYKTKELDELLVAINRGDTSAREKFLIGNVRLVLSIVQRFKDSRQPADDLFQVGMLGLIKATDNFDLSYGVRFSTYAVPMIEGEIRRFVRESTAMKVGRRIRDIAYRAIRAREALRKVATTEVSLRDVSDEIDVPEDEIVAALDAIGDPVSLYDTVTDDEELLVIDKIADSGSEDKLLDTVILRHAISELPDKEKRVVMLRYYDGMTQTEISSALDMSQAQVSRLEKTAISRLKQAF